ncbi:MAG: flagellar protein export ATPase FliI [Limnochordia bacterium]
MTAAVVPQIDFERLKAAVRQAPDWHAIGLVKRVVGLTIEATGPCVSIGDTCFVEVGGGEQVATEVVGFRDDRILMMPLGELTGIAPGAKVTSLAKPLSVPVGPELVGRVLNSLGEPIDGKGPLKCQATRPVHGRPPTPLDRQMIDTPLSVGVRAIDSLITCGKGQRVAIMAGSGVGKSSLLGMMARYTSAEINCIALIGERGREVREFIERDLGPEGLARSIVIVATSDEPALLRIRGAMVATTLAEYFRDQGCDVLLLMDSLTRFAMAQREIGLAIGEPPTTRGYTPSVFSLLPKLLERAGPGEKGAVTGFYTVLVDGDDFTEPIADAVRSIVDGHIVLSRQLGERNHYPAIDVLASVSRVMSGIVDDKHRRAAGLLRDALATYRDAEDLVNVGAYKRGANARIDQALDAIDAVNAFLRQERDEGCTFEAAYRALLDLFPVD